MRKLGLIRTVGLSCRLAAGRSAPGSSHTSPEAAPRRARRRPPSPARPPPSSAPPLPPRGASPDRRPRAGAPATRSASPERRGSRAARGAFRRAARRGTVKGCEASSQMGARSVGSDAEAHAHGRDIGERVEDLRLEQCAGFETPEKLIGARRIRWRYCLSIPPPGYATTIRYVGNILTAASASTRVGRVTKRTPPKMSAISTIVRTSASENSRG